MQDFFPKTVSYNRFVELQKLLVTPLAVYLKLYGLGRCSGISFIDSTPLKVCHIKREKPHRVFDAVAEKTFETMGWYYGFKLHLIANDMGEIIDFQLTKANVDQGQC
ncbi:MAG: transposase [Nonlabens sp.]